MNNQKELTIVKVGGNLIDNPQALKSFLEDFAKLPQPKILVHGGGKLASEFSEKIGIPVQMIQGRRITDKETLKVITMVYGGFISKNIVSTLQSLGCNAIGLSGADANTIKAVKRPVENIDYGFVGDVTKVDDLILSGFLELGLTPVFCAITHNGKGQLLNTNADTMASVIASAMASTFSVSLNYCFEKLGVLSDVNDDNSVIPIINNKSYNTLIDSGVISDGMIPKLHNCFEALNANVSSVHIGGSNLIKANSKTKFTTIQL